MNYNYLIFVPSLVTKASSIEYKVEVDGVSKGQYPTYDGIQTNEAVTKFTIDYLKKQNESLDKIIMLCTDEVRNDQLNEINGKTTLEYYLDSIKHYLSENTDITEEKASEIFEVVPYMPKNNANENEIMESVEKIIKPEDNITKSKKVYIDFTGGVRSAALTLVFVGKILDGLGTNVEKIFYSNLKKEDGILKGTIEECTRTYQIFSKLEEETYIKSDVIGGNENNVNLDNAQAQIRKSRENLVIAKRLNQSSEIEKTNREIDEEIKNIDMEKLSYMDRKILKETEKKSLEYVQEIKNPLLSIKNYLNSKRYEKALAEFRENIFQILLDNRIIKVNNRYLKDGKIKDDMISKEITAVHSYYVNGNHSFIKLIKKYIKVLDANKNKSPVEVWEEHFGNDYFALDNYLNNVPVGHFTHNSYSKTHCKKVINPYIEKIKKKNGLIDKGLSYKLDALYMLYGFPFACTFMEHYYFSGYESLYRDNLKKGIESLEKYYNGKKDKKISRAMALFEEEQFTYESFIEALNNEKYSNMLYILFPFILDSKNISRDKMPYKEWSEFMFEIVNAYYPIRHVRNTVTHRKDTEKSKGDYAIEELKKLISKIDKINEMYL